MIIKTEPINTSIEVLRLTLYDIAEIDHWPGIERPKRQEQPFFSACAETTGLSYAAMLSQGASSGLEPIRRLAVRFRRHALTLGYHQLRIVSSQVSSDLLEIFLEALLFDNYAYTPYLSRSTQPKVIETLYVSSDQISYERLRRLEVLSERLTAYRDLVNTPPSVLTAPALATILEEQSKGCGVQAEIWLPDRIAQERMGGLMAVNRGSLEHARLVQLHWRHPDIAEDSPRIVLVGKGVTFDSGGLNIKTGHYMDDMKQDMTGAALMSQVLLAVAQLKLRVAITAIIPATDNMPFAGALLPGDIITMREGRTVEIINTDAEGRLILADALDIAKMYDPSLVIEASTLTGSASRAIGPYAVVAMEQHASQALAHLKTVGQETDERVVEFPLWEVYDEQLHSDVADIKNCGDGDGGAITAGRFLAHFINYPFIHLDMAGVAFSKKANERRGPGATGFGLTSLLTFIETYKN